MNGSNGGPGHCNSNVDYFSFIIPPMPLPPDTDAPFAAISDELLYYPSLSITFMPPIYGCNTSGTAIEPSSCW
jgi:hypothetical protein